MNRRHKRFAQEYSIDLNATQAAIRVGYSEKTAYSTGQRLLKNVEVKSHIEELQMAKAKRAEVSADEVIRELSLIAFSKATDYARVVEKPLTDDEGSEVGTYSAIELVPTETLTEDQQRALATMKKGRDGLEVKPYDKVRALELLGKHLGLFTDKVDLTGDIGLELTVDYGEDES